MSAKLTITIPEWLDRVFTWPVTTYRRFKYGYPFRRIYLGEGEWTILDQQDYYRFGTLKWTLSGCKKKFYALSGIKDKDGNFKIVRLQRLIMNEPPGLFVDHRNGDSLDNRRENLRIATRTQNVCNNRKRKNKTSLFVGVYFHKWHGLWASNIVHNGIRIFLGYFDSEIEAAREHDRAAIKYHGEFARLNFPSEAKVPEK
jgi:hypothetical protein